MKLNDYQKLALATSTYPRAYAIIYPIIKLNGEAGEVAEKLGKQIRDKEADLTDSDFHNAVIKELGDVLWYCAAIASDLGVTLAEVAMLNLAKLSDRQERGVLGGSGDDR